MAKAGVVFQSLIVVFLYILHSVSNRYAFLFLKSLQAVLFVSMEGYSLSCLVLPAAYSFLSEISTMTPHFFLFGPAKIKVCLSLSLCF